MECSAICQLSTSDNRGNITSASMETRFLGWNVSETKWGLLEGIWHIHHSLSSHPLLLKLCYDFAYRDSCDFEIIPLLQALPQACDLWGLVRAIFFCVMNLFLSIRAASITQNAKFSCKNVSCNRRNLEPAWQPGSCYKMKSELQLVSTWHQSSSEKVKNLSSHPDVFSAWCQTSWCFELSRCLEGGRFQTWNLLHPKSGYC